MTTIAAEFIAWRLGRVWSLWHLADPDVPWQPRCGTPVPDHATLARQPGLLTSTELCARCRDLHDKENA